VNLILLDLRDPSAAKQSRRSKKIQDDSSEDKIGISTNSASEMTPR